LRGFTGFAEGAEPEEVMDMLNQFHGEMGRLIVKYEGTLERFTGDGLMVFFNDPVEIADPEARAVRMAVEMMAAANMLQAEWTKRGWELGYGIGISSGDATLGAIGFEERWDYAAIGSVTNLAARLCADALDGQILVPENILDKVSEIVDSEALGELNLKGFSQLFSVHNILATK
jgi:adenylate cyclase